jgi:hypothetical protein
MPENAVHRIKQLDQERSTLITTAKKEALTKAQAAVSDLNAMGFSYHLVEERLRTTRKSTRQLKDAPCPVCKFKTTPRHDARKHRGQGKRKRPFTSAELKGFGLLRASAA